MRTVPFLLAAVCLMFSGCESKPMGGPVAVPSNNPQSSSATGATAQDASIGIEGANAASFALTPENTRIDFVGTHTGDKPDPRKGRFEKFTGNLQVDPAAKSLKSVSLEIDIDSLLADDPKLTTHLKSSDFFDVREHPKASFESTKVEPDPAAAAEGQIVITGNLTLHGVTKELTVPATIDLSAGPKLRSEFTINRSEFGMDFSLDKIDDKVSLTVVLGEKTPTVEP